ncbi:cation:proton antiporter [Amylibacter marinus]|uniref:Cation:proton antiporter n=1 Tax=Amylibacter marinus TaxID=1475483 RepID=A0ABQ5VY96_9RHOB|nr:monovalent cation/H+ antiporter subunit D family protein [Amylibacter marinus]GLQ36264.1 cation:proton antiporter [Amylibacter marinus]
MAVEPHTVEHTARTLMDHLPVLQVLIPFCTGPIIVFLGSRRLAWPLAFVASALSLIVSLMLLWQVKDGGYIAYTLGGWEPPLGIEYRIDAANAFVLMLISLIGTITLPYALISVADEIKRRDHTLFYACWMLCFTGLLGMVATADAFNVFVFLEISSLSTYVLVAMGADRDRRALTAAYDYLIMGTIGATFFVIGLGMIYMATGTLNMADIADRLADQGANRTVRSGFAFVIVGMGLKIAMFPLHLWLPKAYVFAPSAVTVFLAATATKAAIYVMLRFTFSVYRPEFTYATNTLEMIFLPLAVIAMFSASFVAAFQTNFKRMLAYSSVAQIGYILLGVAILNETGLTAGIVHLFNHGITKALMFMGVGAFVLRAGGSFYAQIAGLGRQMPLTGAALVIGGLSLIGVPGTAGFISKWYLVQAAFERAPDNPMYLAIAVSVVLSSLLAVVYVWRAFEAMYLMAPATDIRAKEAPLLMLVPMWVLAIACIWFGIDTDLIAGAAAQAAAGLFEGSQGMLEMKGAVH